MAQPRIRRTTRKTAALLGACAIAVFGTACSAQVGTAVTQGDTFQFVSPDGQLEIHYDVDERKPLEPLAGPSVMDQDTQVALADYENQVVLVNLWGQWCAPCRSEVDDLQRLQEANEDDGFTVLGINLRDPNIQKPQDFIKDNGVTFPSIWDPSQAAVGALRGFPTSVVPSTLVLDRQHRVAAVFLTEISDIQLQPVISELLAEDNGQTSPAADAEPA